MYTLFQFLFLLGVFVFYRGFEATNPKTRDRKSFTGKVRHFFTARNVKISLLLISAVIFIISLKIHQLTGLFVMTVLVYFLVSSIAVLVTSKLKVALTSKYFIGLAAIIAAMFAGFTFFNLGEFIQYALNFHPTWAHYSKAEDSHYYFWFLTSGETFPIAAFFLIGGLQALVRLNKSAIFILIAFIVPFFFHSLVFSYKASNYIFNVLPFYMLIAAYGIVNLYDAEILNLNSIKHRLGRLGEKVSLKTMKRFTTIVLIIWIPLTLWFRIAIKLPLIKSSGFNGVITHYDWRGACAFLKTNSHPDDLIISTLPLTVLYYLNRVDYNINLAHLDESLKWTTASETGRHNEFYTGVPSVESKEQLERLMSAQKKGWIIADVYRLEKEQYVSKELSEFIKSNLTKVWSDENNTMVIYSWSSQ